MSQLVFKREILPEKGLKELSLLEMLNSRDFYSEYDESYSFTAYDVNGDVGVNVTLYDSFKLVSIIRYRDDKPIFTIKTNFTTNERICEIVGGIMDSIESVGEDELLRRNLDLNEEEKY